MMKEPTGKGRLGEACTPIPTQEKALDFLLALVEFIKKVVFF